MSNFIHISDEHRYNKDDWMAMVLNKDQIVTVESPPANSKYKATSRLTLKGGRVIGLNITATEFKHQSLE